MCHIYVVIDNQNLLFMLIGWFMSIGLIGRIGIYIHGILHSSFFTLHFQRNLHHFFFMIHDFHLIIYRLIHRQYEVKLYAIKHSCFCIRCFFFRCFFFRCKDISHFDFTVMQAHQALHVIESDARSPSIAMGGLLVGKLIVSLEHILHFFLGYVLAAIENSNLQTRRIWQSILLYSSQGFALFNLCRDTNHALRRGVLQGIGEKIAQYLL